MLKHRIIPVLSVNESGQCVKARAYDYPFRLLGPMLQYTKTMERRNVDELIITDITASKNNCTIHNLSDYISDLFCPITVGGGITTVSQITNLIRSGADKVVINTGIWNFEGENGDEVINDLITEGANKHGSQAITVALDVYDNHCTAIYNRSRMVLGNSYYVKDVAKEVQNKGAGEIFLTTIYNEGSFEGYDLKTIEKVSKAVTIPIIAHGGCGKPEHMKHAFNAGANAVAAGSMFLFTENTPRICAEYLASEGFAVRV